MVADKDFIIAEIRRTAADNAGVPLGQRAFERETGISRSQWRGKFWRDWSDALIESGLTPNQAPEAHTQTFLIRSLAGLTRKLGRFPSHADLRLEKIANRSFPGVEAISRLGSAAERVELVRQHASDHSEFADILNLLPDSAADGDASKLDSESLIEGFVYMGLLRVGREKRYKIGKTNLVERRHGELSAQLPADLELVHAIKTDDITGIEAYWHRRFADKCTKGEWFNLSRDDVSAFKRRKVM
jgi:Meiotically up-regulated gene 113